MDLSKIQSGGRLYYKGTSFLSKAIIFFMKRYRKGKVIPRILCDWIPSHEGTLFWLGGELILFSSIFKGFEPDVFTEKYSDKDDFVIVRTKDGYVPEEVAKALKYALYLIRISWIWPLWVLIYWILYIYTGLNMFVILGQKDSYCYQSTYRILDHLYPDKYTMSVQVVPYWASLREDDVIVLDNRK